MLRKRRHADSQTAKMAALARIQNSCHEEVMQHLVIVGDDLEYLQEPYERTDCSIDVCVTIDAAQRKLAQRLPEMGEEPHVLIVIKIDQGISSDDVEQLLASFEDLLQPKLRLVLVGSWMISEFSTLYFNY